DFTIFIHGWLRAQSAKSINNHPTTKVGPAATRIPATLTRREHCARRSNACSITSPGAVWPVATSWRSGAAMATYLTKHVRISAGALGRTFQREPQQQQGRQVQSYLSVVSNRFHVAAGSIVCLPFR